MSAEPTAWESDVGVAFTAVVAAGNLLATEGPDGRNLGRLALAYLALAKTLRDGLAEGKRLVDLRGLAEAGSLPVAVLEDCEAVADWLGAKPQLRGATLAQLLAGATAAAAALRESGIGA